MGVRIRGKFPRSIFGIGAPLVFILFSFWVGHGIGWAQAPTGNTSKKYLIEPVPLNLLEVKRKIGYPIMAQERGLEGKVVVQVVVDRKGRVRDGVCLEYSHIIFRDAVMPYLNEIRFSPGKFKKRPIECRVAIPFVFELE